MDQAVNSMKISLEKINKALIFFALVSLIFRKGNFYNSFIPKPFEIIFVLLIVLTAIYVIKNGNFIIEEILSFRPSPILNSPYFIQKINLTRLLWKKSKLKILPNWQKK